MLQSNEYLREKFCPELPVSDTESINEFVESWKFLRQSLPAPTTDRNIKAAIWLPDSEIELMTYTDGSYPSYVPTIAVSMPSRSRQKQLQIHDNVWFGGVFPYELLREYKRHDIVLARLAIGNTHNGPWNLNKVIIDLKDSVLTDRIAA